MKKILQKYLPALILLWCILGVVEQSACAKKPKTLLIITVTKTFQHSSVSTDEKALDELAAKSGAFTADYCRQRGGDKEIKGKTTLENKL